MKKIFIVGAGILQLPAILKAKSMGLSIAVADMDEQAPGVPYADRFYRISTVDIPGIKDAVGDFLPDGIMTLATDMPVRSVAAAARDLGLPSVSPAVAENATDKIKMINRFASCGVPHPWYEIVASEKELKKVLEKREAPFILKPNDSSGSRGVILVKDKKRATEAFRYSASASRSGNVLLEEFMSGPEVSVETLTINGKTEVLAITDKLTTGAPFFVELGHSQPSVLPEPVIRKIEETAVRAVEAIGIDNSPSHIEMIVTEQGPKLVELGARLGGDCIATHLVPLSTGIDMVESSILLALGQKPSIEKKFKRGAAIRYARCRPGFLKSVTGIEEAYSIPHVRHVEIVKHTGERVGPIHASGDRIGYVIAQANTPESAVESCREALEKIKFEITDS